MNGEIKTGGEVHRLFHQFFAELQRSGIFTGCEHRIRVLYLTVCAFSKWGLVQGRHKLSLMAGTDCRALMHCKGLNLWHGFIYTYPVFCEAPIIFLWFRQVSRKDDGGFPLWSSETFFSLPAPANCRRFCHTSWMPYGAFCRFLAFRTARIPKATA